MLSKDVAAATAVMLKSITTIMKQDTIFRICFILIPSNFIFRGPKPLL